MTACLTKRPRTILSVLVAAALALPAVDALAAEKPSAQDIVNALRPKGLTRSLTLSPEDQAKRDEDNRFVDSLRNRATRSLSLHERQQIAAIAETKPRIDLEIKFDFNSANIARTAVNDLNSLGKALTDPALKGSTFVLAGHTDGVGSDDYNMDLSSRRADTIKKYLIEKFQIAPDKLVTAGYGETRLKNAQKPNAPENRRVEVVNVADR
jgi:outer membrane protein OmpA-like peptidoglycan-associated protein